MIKEMLLSSKKTSVLLDTRKVITRKKIDDAEDTRTLCRIEEWSKWDIDALSAKVSAKHGLVPTVQPLLYRVG